MRQALILAGGKGSRLSKISGGLPKPMVPIAGRPVLEHSVERLRSFGIHDVHFFIDPQSQSVEKHFGTGERFGMEFTYHTEKTPIGTAGGVLSKLSKLDEHFLLIYGDTIFNLDISKLIEFHLEKKSDATLFLHPNDHPFDSDLVEIDSDGRVTKLHPCPHPEGQYIPNLVSAALYVLKKEVLLPWASSDEPIDFAHDIFPAIIERQCRVFGYVSREYIKDMGTPDRFEQVESDLISGKVERGSFATLKPAIFMDRDGTLTQKTEYVRRPEELVLEDSAAEAVRAVHNSEYLGVVITNQPVVARGEVTEDELKIINNKLQQDLGRRHAYLDAIYYCPHHPDKGFAGERAEYKVRCECRKPGIKLIETAVNDLKIKMEGSWFVGDTSVDIQTAKNAGLRSILVKTGYGGRDGKFKSKSDFEAENILEAVRFILSRDELS